MARILISAGDPSGDLYGAMLMRELKAGTASIAFDAVGGPLMQAELEEGDLFHADLASLGVTGFVEPIRRIPFFARLLTSLSARLSDPVDRPDAVICIDFYGFHRRLLAAAKSAGTPAYYFISPQIWASRPGRVRALKRLVERMLVIFPFEEELYRRAGVPVSFVGHPLVETLPRPVPRRDGGALRLGLLPGSRRSELSRHLPLFLRAAARILKDYPGAELTVFAAGALPDALYAPWLGAWRGPGGERARLVREKDYAERARQDFVLTSSGTATLENALLGLPMVVVYKLSWPTYLVARAMIRVPYIAMANLLAGRKLVPELVQSAATPERVAEAALELLGAPARLRALREELGGLRAKLGGPGAVGRVADILLRELARGPRVGAPA